MTRSWIDDDAVTPVVGTVLILLITMAGMGAVLAWGVPAVQGVQDQSSLAAMQGEFSDIRLNTLVLKIVDSSRLRSVGLADGSLALEPGSRFAIHAVHNDTFPGGGSNKDCELRVTGWTDTDNILTIEEDDCGTGLDQTPNNNELAVKIDKLVGSSIQSRPSVSLSGGGGGVWDVDSGEASDDFSAGDWRVRLVDSDDDVVAQVFILGTDRIAWHLQTSVNDMDLYVEAGALFHVDEPQVFNLASVRISENVFASGDYLFELPVYTGPDLEVSSPSDPQVFLQLQGTHGRAVGQDTERLRFDISGDLAEAWCNHLVFRTASIDTGTYAEDPAATCLTGDADGVRSVTYEPEPSLSPFPFELIQKRVYVGLTV